MRNQVFVGAVLAFVALNASSGLTSEERYDGRLAAVPLATATNFASAVRSDRARPQAPDVPAAKGEAAGTWKRPLSGAMMIRMAAAGTDRI
jgi:hypothetical protein